MAAPLAPSVEATLSQIFRTFLLIGATSFGGGVMAYLRSSLVEKHGWPGVVFLLLIRTKINPTLLVLCGAGAGLFAFGAP